mmetsp:Transcript_1334/g.2618  ORF Transcript_1334/g.2618 Transcript_1334/m.2618 type:complete len:218 (+) Transcript_1334:29-682(+)
MSPRGLSYWLGSRLYVAVTNRSNAVPLIEMRGPGFKMPSESGFEPLASEPSAQDIFDVVDAAYAGDERKRIIGMGEDDQGVTYGGLGEPLLRLDVVAESAQLIRDKRHGVPLRLRTNGLVPEGQNGSAVSKLVEAGIKDVSVFFPGADPPSFDAAYGKLEDPNIGFGSFCDFVAQLSDAGVNVECTTVTKPGIDVAAVRQLAEALGAVSCRPVPYFE